MTVTIEVASESGGAVSAKRIFLRSEDYESNDGLEAAVLNFMRSAGQANDVALEGGVSVLTAGG